LFPSDTLALRFVRLIAFFSLDSLKPADCLAQICSIKLVVTAIISIGNLHRSRAAAAAAVQLNEFHVTASMALRTGKCKPKDCQILMTDDRLHYGSSTDKSTSVMSGMQRCLKTILWSCFTMNTK
jgi:hypothetical protein